MLKLKGGASNGRTMEDFTSELDMEVGELFEGLDSSGPDATEEESDWI